MQPYIKAQYSEHLIPYLNQLLGIEIKSDKTEFTCPDCKKEESALLYPNQISKFYCNNPECGFKGDVFDLVRKTKNPKFKDEDTAEYLTHKFKIEVKDDIDDLLKLYAKNKFTLFPLEPNSKNPQKGFMWTEKPYTDPVIWKDWVDRGYGLACFDKETEVLTDQGWKYFKDLDKTEKIATLNPGTHQLEYQTPQCYIKYIYKGEMFSLQSARFDQVITPNHNVYYQSARFPKNKYRLQQARFVSMDRISIPITCKWDGVIINQVNIPKLANCKNNNRTFDIKPFLQFLGWFISEGSLWTDNKGDYRIQIAQINKKNRLIIENLLNDLNLKYQKNGINFIIFHKQLYKYLKKNCYKVSKNSPKRIKSRFCSYSKCLPIWVKGLSPELLKIIYSSLILGDGYKSTITERYYTSSKILANDIQEIIFKMGYSSHIAVRLPEDRIWGKSKIMQKMPNYEIIKLTSNHRTIWLSKHLKKIQYNNYVYCVEVPNSIIYVRRNKKSAWSGNCRLGEASKTVAIDVDDEKTYEKMEKLLGEDTLIQITKRGHHWIYGYEEWMKDIKHINFRPKGYDMEMRANNAYIAIAPTSVEGEVRKWNNKKIQKMSKELKHFLLGLIDQDTKNVEEDIQESITKNDLGITGGLTGLDGQCNDIFIKLGGIFRKKLNIDQTKYALHYVNQLLEKPMDNKTMKGMGWQLEKYQTYDKKELANEVLKRLEIIKEGTAYQIASSLKKEVKDVEDVLKHLDDNNKVIALSGRKYQVLETVQWTTEKSDMSIPVDFRVPYFHKYNCFDWGNMVIIGASSGRGKTHITGNIIKKLVDQNIKPYLITTEAGSKIGKITHKLGIPDEMYYVPKKPVKHPMDIELVDDAITIIDWLKVKDGDYAKTDQTYEHFHNQLKKHRGFLFIFTQLRVKNNEFFAPDLTNFYGSCVAKYLFGNNGQDSENTLFQTEKLRDSKTGQQYVAIPTFFDKDTKILEVRD